MTRSDSLVPLLIPPVAGQGLSFSQGTILFWDPDTFENRIFWKGTTLTNVPVLSGADALTYARNDVVGMLGWSPSGGAGSWWIIGRLVTPGPGSGARAVDFLTSALASAISAQVFAERVNADEVNAGESTNSTTYTNLATVGPTVADVQITEKAIVFMTAFISANIVGAGQTVSGGDMSVEVSGPTDVPAGFEALGNSFRFTPGAGDANPALAGTQIRATATTVVDFLLPGTYTFQAKYRRAFGASTGTSATFSSRNLVVIGL